LRESEAEYAAAKPDSDLARHKLHSYAQQLVKSYCEALTLKSMKAELEHLLALNLSQAKYAAYTKERRAGKEMYQLAFGLRNLPWLIGRAEATGDASVLAELLRVNEVASTRLEAASRQVVRRSLKSASQPEA
jgi:23S rRNA maturation mini-RNase III